MINKLKTYNLLFLLCMLFFAVSCDKEKFVEDKTEGLKLNVDADILRSPVSLQILDAAGELIPENIELELSGSGANLIYSTIGERTLVVNRGAVDFAIDKNEKPTPEAPIEFAVKITSPGYIPTVQTFQITDIDEQQLERIFLVNRSNPPAGVSTSEINISANAEGIEDAVLLSTEAGADVQETAEIVFPIGTKFLDAEGNIVTGNISASAAYFDNRSQSSLDAFPGGFTALNLTDAEGNALDPVQFETAGFLALNLNAGDTEVRNFSQAIPVTMGINPETVNPETGTAVAAGDEIPFWSLDEDTGAWMDEGTAVVVDDNGVLKVNFEITHLSYYNLDWFYGSCSRANITIQSNIPKAHSGSSRYSHRSHPYDYYTVYIYNAVTHQKMKTLYNFGPFYDGQQLTFFWAPNTDVYFEIHTGSYGCSDLIATSDIFNLCNVGTLNLNIPQTAAAAQKLDVYANISGICVGSSQSVEIRPYAYIYYKKSNCYYWNWFGYFSNGSLSNRKLEIGATYDFWMGYSYNYYLFENVTIESGTYTYGNQQIGVTIDANNSVNFNMTNIPIPNTICEGFGL